jgi:hypothetical protein
MPEDRTLSSRVGGLKPYVQSILGLLFLVNAIGLFTYSIGSGALMTMAGLLIFPQIRNIIESKADISLHPLMLAGIIGFLFVGSSALLLTAVDLSQAPDFLVPFEN